MMWFESSKNPVRSGSDAGLVNKKLDEMNRHAPRLHSHIMFALVILLLTGCGAFGLGKLTLIEKTDSDEKYYLAKKVLLTAGSPQPRESFDHSILNVVNLMFIPANEKGHYVTKSIWYDPSGAEYRTIRQTHDRHEEANRGEDRDTKKGTMRMHTMSLQDLYHHKPGRWRVKLFIDSNLVRKLDFTVR